MSGNLPSRLSVGVVVPCRNDQKRLSQVVMSLDAQSPKPTSVVIVDDGSATPVARKDLGRWSGFPIWLMRLPVSRGPAVARNIGVTIVGTDWIIPLDADDMLHPSYIFRCGQVVVDNPRVDVVQTSFSRVTDGVATPDEKYPLPWVYATVREKPPAAITALIRRRVWSAVGGYSELDLVNQGGLEDWDFWLKVIMHPYHFRVHQIREPLFFYTQRSDGVNARVEDIGKLRAGSELLLKYRPLGLTEADNALTLRKMRQLWNVQRM